jgi:hypothetical protein
MPKRLKCIFYKLKISFLGKGNFFENLKILGGHLSKGFQGGLATPGSY